MKLFFSYCLCLLLGYCCFLVKALLAGPLSPSYIFQLPFSFSVQVSSIDRPC